MDASFSAKFFLHTSKHVGNKHKIYCRIIVARKKVEFFTGEMLSPEEWHEEKQRSKKDAIINEKLAEIEQKILKIRRHLIDNGKACNATTIKAHLTGEKEFKNYLLAYFDKFIDNMISKKENSPNTVQHYKITRKNIAQFILSKKRKDITISEVDYTFINDFDLYLASEYRNKFGESIGRNYINKQHSRFRSILHQAVKEDLINKNPYINFKLKNTKTNRAYLTEEELDAIKLHDLGGNASLQRVRDFFLFSVYTGLRFSDAFALKMQQVKTVKKKILILELVMDKTGDLIQIPLLDSAKDIISKYDQEPSRLVHGFILPRYSNQKLNLYLKTIAELVGIERELTHHVARHTFATIALNNDISMATVQKLLGHSDIKTTQIYAKIVPGTLIKEMEKMNKKM